MNPITDQLIALTAALQTVAGTVPADLDELRRFLAAVLIQQNPGIPAAAETSMDPAIAAAFTAGAALAAQFAADGVPARFQQNDELTPSFDAMHSSRVCGPFADRTGLLSRSSFFKVRPFRRCIPGSPTAIPHGRSCCCCARRRRCRQGAMPAGTVWIRHGSADAAAGWATWECSSDDAGRGVLRRGPGTQPNAGSGGRRSGFCADAEGFSSHSVARCVLIYVVRVPVAELNRQGLRSPDAA